MTDLPLPEDEDEENSELEVIAEEVIKHPEAVTDHSVARRLALQVLYEIDSSAHKVGEVLATRFSEANANRKAERYVRQLVDGVMQNQDKLDALIQRYASEFPLQQVAIVDRNVLRMAVYEFAAGSVPVNVIVAEATELANLFGAEGSVRLVNGVLGALADDGREQSLQIIPPPEPEE